MLNAFKIILIAFACVFLLGALFVPLEDYIYFLWPSRVTDEAFITQQKEILFILPYVLYGLSFIFISSALGIRFIVSGYQNLIEKIDSVDFKKWIVGCLIVGIFMRLVWLLVVNTIPVSDPDSYLMLGLELATNNEYVSDYRPVGYPFFLAVVFKIFGNAPLAGLIANTILNLSIGLLMSRLIYRLTASSLLTKITLLLSMTFPDYIASSAIFAAEPLFSVLMLSGINLLISDNLGIKHLLLTGALFAFAALVRPLFLVSFVLVPFILFAVNREKMVIVKSTLVVMVTTLLLISPWTYRNYTVMNAFVPIAPIAGTNLYMGNNPDATGGYYDYSHKVVEGVTSQAEIDKILVKEAVDFILEEPWTFIKMIPYKLYLTYYRDSSMIDWALAKTDPQLPKSVKPIVTIINEIIYHLLLLLAIVAVFLIVKKGQYKHPLFIISFFVVGYLSAFPAVFNGIPRLHYPMLPFIFMCAAYVLSFSRLKELEVD